jgi:hypothetical protein
MDSWRQAVLQEDEHEQYEDRIGFNGACRVVINSKDNWRQAFLQEYGVVHSGGQRWVVNLLGATKIPMVMGCKIFMNERHSEG